MDIKITDNQQIRVERTEYKGRKIVNLNKMFLQDSEFKYGKGVAIPDDPAIVTQVRDALNSLLG